MWKRTLPLAVLLSTVSVGCVVEPPPQNHRPHTVAAVLFSINPNVALSVGAPDTFHGYPILGKLEVRGDDKAELLSALAKGQADKPEHGAKCFIPRHGLRLTKAGDSQDYVICFQCNYIDTVQDGEKSTRDTIDDAPRVVFNRILSEARIPIAQ